MTSQNPDDPDEPEHDPHIPLDNLSIRKVEFNRVVRNLTQILGVSTVHTFENDALVFVELENGIPFGKDGDVDFDPDVSPFEGDWEDYDPDKVYESLLEYEVEPLRIATNRETGKVEYAVAIVGEEDTTPYVSFPHERTTNITLDVRPSVEEKARALLRRENYEVVEKYLHRVPDMVEKMRKEIDYLSESKAREIVADHIGFDVEEIPYGDFRDASEEERAEYLACMEQIRRAEQRAAELTEDYDRKQAREHRNRALDIDAGFQHTLEKGATHLTNHGPIGGEEE